MVRIESNQRSWACKVCTPLTRITAVALVAMALSCGAMPLSRNFQSYTQSLAAIWLALGAYLLIEAIFAGVFDTKGGTSCSGSGLSGRSTRRSYGDSFGFDPLSSNTAGHCTHNRSYNMSSHSTSATSHAPFSGDPSGSATSEIQRDTAGKSQRVRNHVGIGSATQPAYSNLPSISPRPPSSGYSEIQRDAAGSRRRK